MTTQVQLTQTELFILMQGMQALKDLMYSGEAGVGGFNKELWTKLSNKQKQLNTMNVYRIFFKSKDKNGKKLNTDEVAYNIPAQSQQTALQAFTAQYPNYVILGVKKIR